MSEVGEVGETPTGDTREDTRTHRAMAAMRATYRELTTRDKMHMDALKGHGAALWALIDSLGESRELSLAKTHVEDAIMRATRHITG